MDAHQIKLVQDSFAKVVPIAGTAANIFYTRLFEIAPSVKGMFKSDMSDQGRKLMAVLGTVVNGLTRLETIVPVAEKLAQRHVAYGVRADHYLPVGSALLYTLEQGLGDDFTVEVRDAWAAAYGLLSGVMIEAQKTLEAA